MLIRHILMMALGATVLATAVSCGGGKRMLRTTVRDSVSVNTRTFYRDTVIYTPADSARTTLGTDWTAMRKLMAELSRGPKVVQGTKQASVVITKVDSTHFAVEARCEALATSYDSLVQVQQSTILQLRHVQEEVAVKDAEDRYGMPGWAKGAALVTCCLCALLLLITALPLLKQLFNAKA